VVKSGTLNSVSALAGALPTEKYGIVWFAILNSGEDIENFRKGQENLIVNLLKDWKLAKVAPPALTSSLTRKNKTSRNEIFKSIL
jgi:D-alanyl-D-alanine carboxypeptidase/D-alanyl-D-alanine-endopeptidase (penicillin-binding protein 4)